MGKCRINSARKGETLRASPRKVQKRKTKTKVKQTKTSVIKHSNRRPKKTTTTGGRHTRPQQSASTSSEKPCGSTIQAIEAKPLKSLSLNYYKGYFDDVASFQSLAVLSDGRKVIVGCDYYALLFSSEIVKLSAFYMREQPISVACYKNDGFVVMGKGRFCDEGMFKFYLMKANDSNLTEIEHKINPIHEYKVIAITSCNNMIFALCDTVPPSLKLFVNNHSDPIWSRQKDDDGNALFRNPVCITSFGTKQGVRVVVADMQNHGVANFVSLSEVRGKIIKTEQAIYRSIVGLATDKHDNLFVCYNTPSAISVLQNGLSNERIVYKSRNLLTNPSCLAYDKTTEQLLVIDNGHTLHTFKLSYK